MQLQIVGILGLKAPLDIMIFHRDYLQEALEAMSGRTPFPDSMWVMPDSDAAASQVAKQIDEYFANSSSATPKLKRRVPSSRTSSATTG